jgi:hypothetical protein
MENKQKFIEQIKQNFEAEKNTKSYARVQKMAKTISEDLYSEDSHFIYELIQNAQDNNYNANNKKLDFFVYDDGILTKNNEIGFDESNIESICDFNDSTKSKKKALGYIGEKGIGFKSVFAIADNPAIHSNGYKFYFKKNEYIEPYWINTLDNYPKEFQDTTSTNIYLPYSNTFNNKEDIEKKIKDIEPILLLFLDNLDEINIYKNNQQILSVKKATRIIDDNQKIVTIISDNQEDKFVTFSKEIICNPNIKEKKREGVERRKLIIAFPLTEIDDIRLFAFLPTEIRTGLPFLIQADFLLTASRGDILKDKEWNKWLLDGIVEFFVDSFKNLQQIDKYKYLHYLDEQKSVYEFIDDYYQNILEQLKKEKLFLSIKGDFVRSSQICILDNYDFMYKYLQNVNYQNSDGETFFYAHKGFYIPNYLIKKWKIITIKKDDFLRIIGDCSDFFSKLFEENNSLFEQLLKYIGKDYKTKKYLFELPIIPLDQNDKIVFKTKKELSNFQLFFKLDDEGVLNDVFSNLKIISNYYQKYLQEFSFYCSIFYIKQPDIIEILKSLSLNEDFFTNIENNANLLVYIKNNYLQDNKQQIIELLAKHYQFLSKKKHLFKHDYTEANYWNENTPEFSTNLYISEEYLSSKNCIEKIVHRYCTNQGKENIAFISEKYLEYDKKTSPKDLKDLQKEWKSFFNELKINDEIKFENQKLEMWAYDSRDYTKRTSTNIKNIPFIASAIYERYGEDKILHFDIKKLNKEDSVFLFEKIIQVSDSLQKWKHYNLTYKKVTSFYRDFQYEPTILPWIEVIRDSYPIYTKNKKYNIKEVYLEVDEKLKKYFHTLPKAYLSENKDTIKIIFNIEEKPSYKNIIELISNKKIKNFQDIKSLFLYIHNHYGEKNINLEEIPIDKDNQIKYIYKDNFIWKNGKELGLEELKIFYGEEFKEFFVTQVGVEEKPTDRQYISHLRKNPKNYKKIFYKFINEVDELLKQGENPDIKNENIFLCANDLLPLNKIIFNDEDIETTDIPNLFNLPQKYFSIFQNIVSKYQIDCISKYSREVKTYNDIPDDEVQDIYIKLLNYTWDYIFSKDKKQFEDLKNNREFIIETKNVTKGSLSKIVLKIDVDGTCIDIKQNIAIKNETIYLSDSIDDREHVSEIAKFISNKINIEFAVIERFYDKVYNYEEYSKEEYYSKEKIEEPKDNDKFDSVFEKLLNIKVEDDDGVNSSKNVSENSQENNPSTIEEDDTNSSQNSSQSNSSEKSKAPSANEKIKCPECKKLIYKDKLKLHLYKDHHKYDIDPDDNSIYEEKENIKSNKKNNSNSLNENQTLCPECNCKVNKNNLEKHLCKVHNQSCKDSGSDISLEDAIGKHRRDINKTEENINPNIIQDEENFRKKIQEKFNENMQNSSALTMVHYGRKKAKVGKQETKEFLKKQYKGYCQICGFTFEQKNYKGKYFELFDWLSEKIGKQKSNVINAGSSLCLCAKCHSSLKYGDFEAKFLSTLKNIDTFNEFTSKTNTIVDNDKIPKCYNFIEMDMYKIPIRLLNEEQNIFYTEEHFLHFYTLLNS